MRAAAIQAGRGPRWRVGHQVDLLEGGRAFFPSLWEALARAEHDIWLCSYILADDASARVILDALKQAASRGVRVHLLLDGFGSHQALEASQDALKQAGIRLAVFRPHRGWWQMASWQHLRRLHSKMAVIDGRWGFVGGINLIDDCHDQHHGTLPEPRLDYAVRLQGPVVMDIQRVLRRLWTRASANQAWKEDAAGWLQGAGEDALSQARAKWQAMRDGRPWRLDIRALSLLAGQGPAVALVTRDNLFERRAIEWAYLGALESAVERVDLVTPYFYPGRRLAAALVKASRRGVRIRLLTQGQWDYRLARWAAQQWYGRLMREGIEVYEYTAAFLHGKVAAVDGRWATVGSSNIDPLSLQLNLEANVVVWDAEFAQQLHDRIEGQIGRATLVRHAPVRGLWRRLQVAMVAMAAKLYLRLARHRS